MQRDRELVEDALVRHRYAADGITAAEIACELDEVAGAPGLVEVLAILKTLAGERRVSVDVPGPRSGLPSRWKWNGRQSLLNPLQNGGSVSETAPLSGEAAGE